MKRLLSFLAIVCLGFMLLTANMSCNTIAGMGQGEHYEFFETQI